MPSRLPVISSKKLIRAMKKAGFIVDRQKGSHVSLYHTDRPNKTVTIPYHTKDLKKGTLKSILKQAELDVETLIKLL